MCLGVEQHYLKKNTYCLTVVIPCAWLAVHTAKQERTPNIILVGVVDLLHSAVSESEFPHPVHSSVDPRPQAQRAGSRWALETV